MKIIFFKPFHQNAHNILFDSALLWNNFVRNFLSPDLHALEEKFSTEDGVVVVGVHSAKFDNERVVGNIKEAVLRYGIQHAVVNDSEAVLWNQMKIQCWPTFVIVGPDGKCLLYMVGEGHRQTLLDFVSCAVAFYKKNGMYGINIPRNTYSLYLRY